MMSQQSLSVIKLQAPNKLKLKLIADDYYDYNYDGNNNNNNDDIRHSIYYV
jgi:hypothetical protein